VAGQRRRWNIHLRTQSSKESRESVMKSCKLVLCIALFLGVAAANSQAQRFLNNHKWTANIGAGVTPVVGDTETRFSTGWNIEGGVGYMFTPRLGVIAEARYNGLGVDRSVLLEFGVPGASAWLWSVTANPIYRFSPTAKFDPYIVGGIGFYRRTVEFTRPTTTAALVFDPFFGFHGPALVPATIALGSISNNAFGFNAGIGFDTPIGNRYRFFAEARYEWADTPRATELVPITVGVRF
jgi:opacity protein-like surface antigen